MFYKLITQKRNQWLQSDDCTVRELLAYIEKRRQMRDAQIEAIKTYLFLKIKGNNQPLWKLFVEGAFNSLNINKLSLTVEAREELTTNKAAVALLEYARLKDKKGKQLAPELEKFINNNPTAINYKQTFKQLFYNIDYTDYLFSLPMGAGKTFLMAAFIYLDLYFAQNEPENKAFAHNFIIFAPSGLKSSVVPSLKTIQRFDPAWLFPEPAATNLKRLLKFEVLDQQKSQNKSNKTKNPNTQKINSYQPLDDLFGLVAVTNAEKVILNKVFDDSIDFQFTEDEKYQQANELRNIIGKIPNLAIYIDEVHHVADEDIKLRKVVSKWTEQNTFNSVIGFSGTPYLEKAEPVTIAEQFTIKNIELSNVVYYYPLIDGINNFLKAPFVKESSSEDSLHIVENGVKDFLDTYKDKIYNAGTTAKLAVYCGSIENLEENIYPKIAEIAMAYELNPNETILKYHKGNSAYKISKEAETEFASLDLPLSKIKIILLVQIGKEGWDCRSLTGVVLSQKGDCPTNMVLQTSCRCLRQVDKGQMETAVIWLNRFNADTLNAQLQQQQNITLQEFENAANNARPFEELKRYSRMDYLKLPPIDFYQLKVKYDTLIIETESDTAQNLKMVTENASQETITITSDLEGKTLEISKEKEIKLKKVTFNEWLYLICKESFGFVNMPDLNKHTNILQKIFNEITLKQTEYNYKSIVNQTLVRSNIRKAFYEKRDIKTVEEIIPAEARLLKIENFTSEIQTQTPEKYHPEQKTVDKIVRADNGEFDTIDEKTLTAIQALELAGQAEMAENLKQQKTDVPERKHTWHNLPYRFDSNFEKRFLTEVLKFADFKEKGLELYFNGDDALTEFQIACYKKSGYQWRYIGKYIPDFLLLKRGHENKISQAIIIETKGGVYAGKFKDKRNFMEQEFIRQNNEKYGYERLKFLYLEDTLTDEHRISKTINAINNFFNEI